MTLLYPATNNDIVSGQPRLHALVIGVADYPHLSGGKGPPAADSLNLGQVTTPQPTVLAIADWLQKTYHNSNKPLGSLELVLSPSVQPLPNSQPPPGIEPATLANIRAAFKRWLQRCSSGPDNVAFFYFCGHGLAREEQFLLAEDFRNPADPDDWSNCINFDALRVGMYSCKAQTQVFFIDACRETPFGMLMEEPVGARFVSSKIGDSVKCSATYNATADGAQAYGPKDAVTYFGQALMECLNGLAASRSNGAWHVTTSSLAKSLIEVMDYYADAYRMKLVCNPNVTGNAVVHEPDSASVLACIQCTSPAATTAADIRMSRNGTVHLATTADLKPLVRKVEPGEWEFAVSFPGGGFQTGPPMKDLLMPGVYHGVPRP
jgi:hypothetical protein